MLARILTLLAAIVCLIPTIADAQSTSPDPVAVGGGGATSATPEDVITFSEFPLDTPISDQYSDLGIIFGGDSPFISLDSANPTAPVLSGTPRFHGVIAGRFVDPEDPSKPAIVRSFSLDAGYFDSLGSTRIEWFDPDGKKLGQRTNSQFAIENFLIEGGNIASWRFGIIEDEPAGFAIDNFSSDPVRSSIVFREKSGDDKDGSWGRRDDEIPGFDHVGLKVDDTVYESHPGYPSGVYVSEDGSESRTIKTQNGVQSQHSGATFAHDATAAGRASSPVVKFEEIPIEEGVATLMRAAIGSRAGSPFQLIDFSSLAGISETLAPSVQKGGDGSFTCVGLVEWAAEQAGVQNGQGFIQNRFEAIPINDGSTNPPTPRLLALLSPQLLNYALKAALTLQSIEQYLQGLLDPVDFIITDPLGRRLGFTQELGEIREIPKAFFSGDGKVEQFLIPNPVAGTYRIEYFGLGETVRGAVASSTTTRQIDQLLPQGQRASVTVNVELRSGGIGDVNRDGKIDQADVTLLETLLNRFVNDPNDPGDLDADGRLSANDVTLLKQLIKSSSITLRRVTPPNGRLPRLGANASAVSFR